MMEVGVNDQAEVIKPGTWSIKLLILVSLPKYFILF